VDDPLRVGQQRFESRAGLRGQLVFPSRDESLLADENFDRCAGAGVYHGG
jgi:hypothetical protein